MTTQTDPRPSTLDAADARAEAVAEIAPYRTGSLRARAMLVTLNISAWDATRTDRAKTKEIAAREGASPHMLRLSRHLIDPDRPTYRALAKIATQARTDHYKYTAPWTRAGASLLPVATWPKYTAAMREHEARFAAAVAAFRADYPAAVEDARAALNGLFKDSDYPTADAVAARFRFKVTVDTVPAAEDFRADLADADLEAVRADIEARTMDAAHEAVAAIWARLAEAVAAAVERLAQPAAVFHDTLITNLREIVALAPAFAEAAGDPALAAAAAEIDAQLAAKYQPQVLRTDAVARAQAAETAAALARMIDDYRT